MLIKPEKVLLNEKHILELVDLLVELKRKAYAKHPEASFDVVDWAVEQAILRTSLNDGVEFGTLP